MRRTVVRRVGLLVRIGLAAASLTSVGTLPAAAKPKVVVLGFDGADAEVTRRLMDEGRLPNLSRLEQEGGFWPLLPTNPPQTPVSWSSFATGLNPGRTEVFDFIKKQGRSYLPALCAIDDKATAPFLAGHWNGWLFAAIGSTVAGVPLLFAVAVPRRRRALLAASAVLLLAGAAAGYAFGSQLLPVRVPKPVNNRKGVTFWEVAVRHGLHARVIRVPVTFPADRLPLLTMLSGLGVPDVRGLNGQPTLYTTRPGVASGQFSVKVVPFVAPRDEASELAIEGPRNLLFPPAQGVPERLRVPLRLTALGAGRVRIEAGDRESELDPGAWSDWHVLRFAFNPILRVQGIGRFYNQSDPATGVTEVVLSPIHFHPAEGGRVGFSHPGDHAARIARKIGLFKTMGWSIDTWTVSDGLASQQHCLEDAEFTTAGVERLLRAELEDPDTDLYVQVFSFTDRIQHVFWHLGDPDHPGYDAELAREYEGTVERAYERMDRIVGEARSLVPADAVFIVLSDHGFTSFRRGVNLNRWLVDHGYLVLTKDPCHEGAGGGRSLDDLFEDASRVFGEVDWSLTRAYAMGLGNVYVNLAGREPGGIVRPGEEYAQLVGALSAELEAFVDPETGERPVRRVYHRDETYHGYDPELIPDLRVANARNYRVSWDTVLGGIPCAQVEDNLKAWGADHCSVDPELVKGILVANRGLAGGGATITDLAPTILAALGLPPPPGLDGRSLL